MKTAIDLLDEILIEAEHQDKIHKAQSLRGSRASQSVGESWMVFHLKALKELLESGARKTPKP
jgi:hypothetical protein